MSHLGDGSYSRGENAGPCKACHAFKEWVKIQGGKPDENPSSSTAQAGHECPLDKDELGRSTWSFLHSMAAYYPDSPSRLQQSQACAFFKLFGQFYPCESCAVHYRQDIEQIPPDTKSSKALSEWLCNIHNRVNVRLGKPEFDCTRVFERWRDGWKDGSCDP